jgi:hypothetical protein
VYNPAVFPGVVPTGWRSIRMTFVPCAHQYTYWFFNYLETERGYSSDAATTTMAVAVLVLAAGYFAGGMVGDFFFRRTPRGRLIVAAVAVLLGAILLVPTIFVPAENQTLFLVMLSLTALFIPFASPNVTSTVLYRVGRRGPSAPAGRPDRRSLVAAGRHPAHLRLHLGAVCDPLRLHRLPGTPRRRSIATGDARAGREGAANRELTPVAQRQLRVIHVSPPPLSPFLPPPGMGASCFDLDLRVLQNSEYTVGSVT